jgi:hypothetical protein
MHATKTSLRSRLLGVWALSLLACSAVGVFLVQFYQQSTTARVGRADAVIARACDLIRDRYDVYAASWSGAATAQSDKTLRSELATAVALALVRQNGVEGGESGRPRPDRSPTPFQPTPGPGPRPICRRPSATI